MKRYLREKFTHSTFWKRDFHCKKDRMVNWWETFDNEISRRTMKQRIKKDIEYEKV